MCAHARALSFRAIAAGRHSSIWRRGEQRHCLVFLLNWADEERRVADRGTKTQILLKL